MIDLDVFSLKTSIPHPWLINKSGKKVNKKLLGFVDYDFVSVSNLLKNLWVS